ncbi:MAG: hypothetical protein ACI8T1_004712 [Verrucomicrobiales bacterium]|jgi:hypothetical protein
MNKKTILSIALMLAATGAVTAWVQTQNAKLKQPANAEVPVIVSRELGESLPSDLLSRSGSKAGNQDDGKTKLPVPKAKEWTAESLTTAGLEGILAETNPMDRLSGLLAYAELLPPNKVGQALADLRAGSPDWDPEAKFVAHVLLTRWGKEDPEGALASLEAMKSKNGREAVSSVLASVAASDPELALEWLNDPDNKLQYQKGMGHILTGTIAKEWVRRDPDAAYAWAVSLPDDQRAGALGGVVESLASTDPKRAAEMVLGMENDDERNKYLGDISQSWGRQTPSNAIEWAKTLGDEKQRNEAIDEVLDGWAQRSPADAAAYVDALPADERDQGHISEVAKEWARRDPAEAADWLSNQEEGRGKTASIAEVMTNWTTADPVAASSWLAEQPPSDSRDAGAATLARVTFDSDPEAALSWGATISNEKFRGFAVEAGLREWGKRDASAAQAWATANNQKMPAPAPARRRDGRGKE